MKRVLLSLFILSMSLLSFAQEQELEQVHEREPNLRWSFSPQVGTDIGVTLPYPMSAINGIFNPYPDILPSLGARTSFRFKQGWILGAEVTYKTVSMTANARVENQMMLSNDNTPQYFSGTAFLSSSFSQLEVPLYVKYMIGKKGTHRVLLGGYWSYILDGMFTTEARKGYIGSEPDSADNIIDPSNPILMDFSSSLGNWDAGIVVGYELGINEKLNMGIRIMTGLRDIFGGSTPFEYKMIHLRGTIVVSYNIFETNR